MHFVKYISSSVTRISSCVNMELSFKLDFMKHLFVTMVNQTPFQQSRKWLRLKNNKSSIYSEVMKGISMVRFGFYILFFTFILVTKPISIPEENFNFRCKICHTILKRYLSNYL